MAMGAQVGMGAWAFAMGERVRMGTVMGEHKRKVPKYC